MILLLLFFDCCFAVCNLRCWLYNATISIPAASFNGTISLADFACSKLQIGRISSSADLRNTALLHLDVNTTQVSLQCAAQWTVAAFGLSRSGVATVHVNQSQLQAGVAVTVAHQLPSQVALSACTSAFHAQLDFDCGQDFFCDLLRQATPLVLDYVTSQLNSRVCGLLTDLVRVNGTAALLDVEQSFVEPLLTPEPSTAVPMLGTGLVSLQNNSAVELVDYVLDTVVGVDGALNINRVVAQLTNNTGVFVANQTRLSGGFNYTVPISGLGHVEIELLRVQVSGLQHWSDFDVLRPRSDYLMRSIMKTGAVSVLADFDFVVVANNSGPVRDGALSERAQMRANFSSLSLTADTLLGIKQERLQRLYYTQAASLDCVLQVVESANLSALELDLTLAGVSLHAQGGDLEHDVDQLITNAFQLTLEAFDQVLPQLIHGIVAQPLRRAANDALAQQLAASVRNGTCPAIALQPGNPLIFYHWGTQAAIVAWLVSSLCIVVCMCCNQRRHNRSQKRELAPLLDNDDDYDDDAEKVIVSEEPSLARHPKLPFVVRAGVPITVCAIICVFFSSNTSVGASVIAVLNVGSRRIEPAPLFEFSLINSIRDMWNARVYALSLLVAVFSGFWVYFKLLMMLVCWFVPPSWLAVRRRSNMLYVLDLLGKWSLIDIFVLVMMMVSFRFHLAVPQSAAISAAPAALDIYVHCQYGFYSFLVATCLSLLLTHVIVALHRYATEDESDVVIEFLLSLDDAPSSGAASSIQEHGDLRQSDEDSLRQIHMPNVAQLRRPRATSVNDSKGAQRWISAANRRRLTHRYDVTTCTGVGSAVVVLLLLATGVLVCIGAYTDSFVFVFSGAAGVALEYLNGSDRVEYSLWSLGTTIFSVGQPGDETGTRFIQVVFMSVALAAPLVHIVLMLVLWLAPMPLRAAKRLLFVNELVHAWASLDVFGVSLLVALFEIRQFAVFILGDRCDLINKLLQEYASVLLDGHNVCFDVKTILLPGCWMLVAAFALYFLVSSLVMHLAHTAISPERDDTDKAQRDHSQRRLSMPKRARLTQAMIALGMFRGKLKVTKS